MARFSAIITTERDSEVQRLGHNFIRTDTRTHDCSIHVRAYTDEDENDKKIKHEKMVISFGAGYQDYYHNFDSCPAIWVEDGIIKLSDHFMENIEKFNKETRQHKNLGE